MVNPFVKFTAKTLLGIPLAALFGTISLVVSPISEAAKGAHEGSISFRATLAKIAAGFGAATGILTGVGFAAATGYYPAAVGLGLVSTIYLTSQAQYHGEEVGRTVGGVAGATLGLLKGILICPIQSCVGGFTVANQIIESVTSDEATLIETATANEEMSAAGEQPIFEETNTRMMTTQFDGHKDAANQVPETQAPEAPAFKETELRHRKPHTMGATFS